MKNIIIKRKKTHLINFKLKRSSKFVIKRLFDDVKFLEDISLNRILIIKILNFNSNYNEKLYTFYLKSLDYT